MNVLALPTVSPPTDPSLTLYHSFGDSITEGYLLADPATEAYPVLVGAVEGLPTQNYAFAGDQGCDVSRGQIFAHQDGPSTAKKALYSLVIGTNDADVRGKGAYEAIFNVCEQAAIAWLALPVEYKVLGNSAAVTSSGAGHLETTNNWNARWTDARGAALGFAFQSAAAGPVYAWYRIVDGSGGSFSYAVDGATVGSGATGTMPAMQTHNGGADSLGLLRLPSMGAGAHVLSFTQMSDGPLGVGVVAVGFVPDGKANFPRVLVGSVPTQKQGGGGLCDGTSSPCAAYTADSKANVALFAGDGLDVRLFDSGKYMSGTNADMADSIHPNALGDKEIAAALEEAVP